MSSDQPWHGKLIDVTGRVGTIDLEISDNQEKPGYWKAQLSERDTVLELEGDAKSEKNETGLTLSLNSNSKESGQIDLKLNMQHSEAGKYANAALLGEYESFNQENPVLTRGVIVFWQFK